MWMVAGLALAGPSAQTNFDVQKHGETTTLTYGWRDEAGAKHRIAFDVPTAEVAADRTEERYLPRREMYEAAAKAVRALDVPKVKLTAKIEDGGLRIGAEGRGDVRGALKQAEVVRDEAIDRWLSANSYTTLKGGEITFAKG